MKLLGLVFYLPAIITFLIIVFFVYLITYIFSEFLKKRGKVARSLNLSLLKIRMPKEKRKEDEKKNFRELISVFEQFLSTISSIKDEKGFFDKFIYGKPYIALEATLLPSGSISFFLAAPRKYQSFITEQIHSFYPDALVAEVRDYTIFNPGDEVAISIIKTAKDSILPIKTYEELQTDPFDSVLTSMIKGVKGGGASLQVLLKPAEDNIVGRGRDIIKKLFEGKSLKEVLREGGLASEVVKIAGVTKEVLSPSKKKETQEGPRSVSSHQEKLIEIIQKKIEKPVLRVICRVVASGKTKEEAKIKLSQIEGTFAQFSSPIANYLGRFKVYRQKRLLYDYVFRSFDDRHSFVLNTEEIASLFHFPLPISDVPNINWAGAREAAAPVELPTEGILLGMNLYRGKEREVRLKKDDRRRHFYMIGQTGTGKTTLFKNMIIQDIKNNEGVGIIDPHGDLAENILGYIPKERFQDVIIFNPADIEMPLGLNMLEYKTDEEMDFAVAEMIRIFEKLFPPEVIGPMFEHNMRNAMLTLMADKEKPGTICEIPRIFTDVAFQKEKLEKVKDPHVKDFWEKEEAKTSDFHKSEKLGYIISKVGRFVENRMMRNIIGQRRSAFDFREIMDNGKILIVNLSKGKVGEINSALLGLILVSKLQMAAMERAEAKEEERRDFYLYIDEFQNFITESIATILSEARKYRLSLNITHQFIGQLSDEIRESVIGNVGTMLSFRIGAKDAEFMEKEFSPVFTAQDLINLDFARGYLRLLVDGAPTRPFSIKTLSPEKGFDAKKKELLLELSRKKYGRPRPEIEKEGYQNISQTSQNRLETDFGGETRR